MERQAVTGVVLCGGKSRRMGIDKATLELAGRTLLEHAIDVLDGACAEVVLACGQRPRYAELDRRLALDRRADAGPLAGLEAGFASTDAPWLAVIACDMPGARSELYIELLERAVEDDLDACLLEGPRGVEPLCGVWRADCGASVSAALDAGERRVVAFERFETARGRAPRVGRFAASELRPGFDAHALAANLNTPDDFAAEVAAREEAP